MDAFLETQAQSLLDLASKRFGRASSPLEEQILRESAGSLVYTPPADPIGESPIDPEFLRWLASDRVAATLIRKVTVRNAIVDGPLELAGGSITVPWWFDRCIFSGRISLDFAEIPFLLLSSCVANKGLSATRLVVNGPLTFHGENPAETGFHCIGKMDLSQAKIAGDLCACGMKCDAEPVSLNLDDAKISGNANLRHGFVAKGTVRLVGTEIGGDLDCSQSSIDMLGGNRARVGDAVIWRGIKNTGEVLLSLSDSSIGILEDDKASWPRKGRLNIAGLTYDELDLADSHPSALADERIEWLNRQNDTYIAAPQPWIQLAQLLKARGDKAGARRAVFELRRHQAKRNSLPARVWKIYFARLEEKPMRIVIPMTILICLGLAVFRNAENGAIAPTNKEAYMKWAKTGEFSDMVYPRFNALMYSFESSVPFVKLGLDDKWAPNSNFKSYSILTSYGFLTGFRWFLVVAGWIQGTVLAAALGSRFKND